jgi:hypothetical protein
MLDKFLIEMKPNTVTVRGKEPVYNLGRPIYVWRYSDQGVQYIKLSRLKVWLKERELNIFQVMAAYDDAYLVLHRIKSDKIHRHRCLMIPIQS